MLSLGPDATRFIIARHYERVYWSGFCKLMVSTGADMRQPCGCPVGSPHLWLPGPVAPKFDRCVYVRAGGAGWSMGYASKLAPGSGFKGLVVTMWYGASSRFQVTLEKDGQPLALEGRDGFKGLRNVHLNNVLLLNFSSRVVSGRTYPIHRLSFQIACDEHTQLVAAYRLVGRLQRNRKSYFSWLPKELVRYIRYLLFE